MKTEILTVTPEMAKNILLKNTKNRPIIATRVAEFEAQLLRGEMQLTHQGIAISETNILLDGQHRLIAISNTGVAAKLQVSTGLPDSVFAVLDTGSKRSPGNVLSISGAPNSNTTAAAIRLYILYAMAADHVWTGKKVNQLVSTTLIDQEYNSDKDTWDWAAKVAAGGAIGKICTPGPMCCLAYLAYMRADYAQDFIEGFVLKLKSGAGLYPGNAILAYRNKIISGGTVSGQVKLADYIKLFNAYSTAQQLKIFKSQQFPPMPLLIGASESIHENAQA
jgi:hypothetical protein